MLSLAPWGALRLRLSPPGCLNGHQRGEGMEKTPPLSAYLITPDPSAESVIRFFHWYKWLKRMQSSRWQLKASLNVRPLSLVSYLYHAHRIALFTCLLSRLTMHNTHKLKWCWQQQVYLFLHTSAPPSPVSKPFPHSEYSAFPLITVYILASVSLLHLSTLLPVSMQSPYSEYIALLLTVEGDCSHTMISKMVAATVTQQWVRVVRADLKGQVVVECHSGEHGA